MAPDSGLGLGKKVCQGAQKGKFVFAKTSKFAEGFIGKKYPATVRQENTFP
jgi:hypothetical protein